MNIKQIIKQQVAERMNRLNEQLKENGKLVQYLTGLKANGKLEGFDLAINGGVQLDLLKDLVEFIDSQLVETELKSENDDAGFYRPADDNTIKYYVKKQDPFFVTLLMVDGSKVTVSEKLHDEIEKAGSKLWAAWGNYNLDVNNLKGFLTAYFGDKPGMMNYEVANVQKLPATDPWPMIKARMGESFNRLLKAIIREEVRKALRSAQPAQLTKGKGTASAASRLTETSEWEVGKSVQYKNLRTAKPKINKIVKKLGNGRWELEGGHIAYEKDPEFKLTEDFASTGNFHELERYVKANRNEILNNMKIYGFRPKDIYKMQNYRDVATLLGVDARLLRDVDLGEFTRVISGVI